MRYIAIMWNIPVAREVAVKKPSNVRQNQNFIMSFNSVTAQELYLDNPVNSSYISSSESNSLSTTAFMSHAHHVILKEQAGY